MGSRKAPEHVRDALWRYDRHLDVEWDDESEGWRLVHKNVPCDFILLHPDGTLIVELTEAETLRIVRQSDQHHEYGAVLKRWRHQRGERAYERRVEQHGHRDAIRKMIHGLTDHFVRDTGKAGKSAKPFTEVHQPA